MQAIGLAMGGEFQLARRDIWQPLKALINRTVKSRQVLLLPVPRTFLSPRRISPDKYTRADLALGWQAESISKFKAICSVQPERSLPFQSLKVILGTPRRYGENRSTKTEGHARATARVYWSAFTGLTCYSNVYFFFLGRHLGRAECFGSLHRAGV